MYHRFYIPAFILLLGASSCSQSNYLNRGKVMMSKSKFEKAAVLLKKAIDNEPGNVEAWDKLAETFIILEDYKSAESIYKTLSENPLASHEVKFKYAQLLRSQGKFEEAKIAYSQFSKAMPVDPRTEEFNNFEEHIELLKKDAGIFELTNVPENSAASEIGPALLNNNLTFSSNRKGNSAIKVTDNRTSKPFYDVFTMQETSTGKVPVPSKAKGRINCRLNEGPACYSADGLLMVFTKSNYKKKGEDGIRKLGLYTASFNAARNRWTNVKPLPFNSRDYNNAHPSLSTDANKLFFVSDMPGGIGSSDLYMSLKNGNTWENPINLGKVVNTPGQEMTPFIAADGKLYFSSDSRVGLGGLDIYSATQDKGKWGNVQNLGTPVNTSFDDFGYISDVTGKAGYLVSNRQGGVGGDDIYKYVQHGNYLCGKTIDAKAKKVMGNVKITALGPDSTKLAITSSEDGSFCILLPENKKFELKSSAEGFSSADMFVTMGQEPQTQDLFLFPYGGIELLVDVAEQSGGQLANATAFVIDKKSGEVVQGVTNEKGQVKFDLFQDKEYEVKVVKPLENKDSVYTKFVKAISTLGYKPLQVINEKVSLEKYETKYAFDMPNVYFDYNKYDLNDLAKKELSKVVKVMNEFPGVEVELSAHTDSRGGSKSNLELSAMRAEACVNYLQQQGVDITKLIAIGFGEMKIRNKCIDYVPCTDKEHAVNRRIEFKVVKFN